MAERVLMMVATHERARVPRREAGAGMLDSLSSKLLSSQVLILIGQVLELKVEVGLLRGMPLDTAVDCAFAFLDRSLILSELFDDDHRELLKDEYRAFFLRRDDTGAAAPPPS